MDKNVFDGIEFKIPDLATGKVVPYAVQQIAAAEERVEAAERKARLYFWGGIIGSMLCTIAGWLLGKFF